MKIMSRNAMRLGAILLVVAATVACGGPEARKERSLRASQAYLAENNLEKARVELRNVLQIDPNDAEARYLSGVIAERLENTRQAAAHYSGALDVAPDHILARAGLAKIYVFAGLPSEAIGIIEEGYSAENPSAELLAVRGAAKAKLGDMEGAYDDASRAYQLAPENERAVALYAGVLTRMERLADAGAVLDDGISLNPKSADLRIARATLAERQGDWDHAEALYREIVDLVPTEAIYRYQLAAFLARRGDLVGGEFVLREAIAVAENPAEPRRRLISYLESQVGRAAAEQELVSMKGQPELAAEAGLLLAAFYQRTGDLAAAEAELRAVLQADPGGPDGELARSRLGSLKISRGERDEGLRLLEAALENNPRASEALRARAALALQENRADDAIVDLRVLLRDDPDSAALHQGLAQAHLLKNEYSLAEESLRNAVRGEPGNLDVRIQLARLMAQAGKNDEADALLNTVLVTQPGNLFALETAFRIALGGGRWDQALSRAESLIEIDAASPLGHYFRGLALEGAERPEEALAAYEAALERQPVHAEALAAWSRILVGRQDYEPVIERLDNAWSAAPGNAAIGNLRGEVLLTAGRVDEARTGLAAVIESTPQWWLPYRTLARSYAAADPDQAIAVLTSGFEASGEPAGIGIELAAHYERQGRIDDAIEVYERMIKANASSDVLANNLAMLLATYRDDEASLARARELTRTFATSTNAAFLNTFGWVRLQGGDLQSALPVLSKAVDLSPASAIMRYHLGMAYLEQGDHQSARAELALALQLDDAFPGADRARQALTRLDDSASNGTG